MGPDLTAARRATACPSCGAATRPGADFCGQCYADFRPPPPAPVEVAAPVLVPVIAAAPAPRTELAPSVDPLTAPLLDVLLPPVSPAPVAPASPAPAPAAAQPALLQIAEPEGAVASKGGWPCSRCQSMNGFERQICQVCASPFLAKVREETKVELSLPLVGDLAGYGRGQRAAIAIGAVVAVILIPLALVTLLLTKAPASSTTPKGAHISNPVSTPVATLPSDAPPPTLVPTTGS